ncbi:hypothetical protein AV540_07740 [Brevibacillus parabrevis]|uniref:hypothetical protein n=1 Tax=Brevibacillus parabrevis TaxID=54914 RepID=UPI0007ABBA41|nr:hypothetical protein [Brevibacillus parabrevis]KZE54105.1 hypothetical protein AV540_07740 [Brevibacillus parabrevis]
MLELNRRQFIEQYYLRKGEVLDQPIHGSNGFELDILKYSARTCKRVGKLTGGRAKGDGEKASLPPAGLLKTLNNPRSKKSERELVELAGTIAKLHEWMNCDWLMRKVDYELDGKTVRQTWYVMGFSLHEYVSRQIQEANEQLLSGIRLWQKKMTQRETQDSQNRKSGTHPAEESWYSMFESLQATLANCLQNGDPASLWRWIKTDWRKQKQVAYIEFIIAVNELKNRQTHFDWKEIGAYYYEEIGGSKVFDLYKDDFLAKLENDIGFPVHLIGMVSLGTITPILFAGELRGDEGLYYPNGFIHATTDLTVLQMQFATSCTNMWLVENRAVLTRMSVEPGFLYETKSLVIALDGQLRSGHRKLIMDLLDMSPSVRQVLVWCDTDEAGLTIARHLSALLQSYRHTRCKWILPSAAGDEVAVAREWEPQPLEQKDASYLIGTFEQEINLGGAEWWRRLIDA